jgi:RNA polymerase sigma factor (sigma-70 family)
LNPSNVGVLVARRSRERMADLYVAHAPDAFRLAYLLTGDREAAADIVQDAFVRLVGRFRDLREPQSFGPYLRSTVVNLSRDRFRRLRSERARVSRQRALRHEEGTTEPDVEARDVIGQALRSLPYRQQAALILRYYEDLSEHETAQTLRCSVSAVKALVTRGTSALREKLRGEEWT